jgi:hypothetical protein
VPICPFGSKLVVRTLDMNLSVVSLLTRAVGCIHRYLDRDSLRGVWPVMFSFKGNLPLALVIDDVILGPGHALSSSHKHALPLRQLCVLESAQNEFALVFAQRPVAHSGKYVRDNHVSGFRSRKKFVKGGMSRTGGLW